MAIKWKKCSEMLKIKKNNLIVAVIAGILFVLSLIVIYQTYRYVYCGEWIVFMFASCMISIVFFTRFIMMLVKKRADTMVDLAFGRWYFMTFVISLIICGVYAVAATVVLRAGYTWHLGYGNWASYSEALVYYGHGWIVAFIYLVPILSVLVTVIIESERARSYRVGMLDSELRREQQLATMEKDKAIEEQGKAAKEQDKANQLSVELLTNVTHDLKTPLTAIIGYLALMEKEELTPVLSDYLKVAMQKSELLKDMIDRILELSKAGSGNAVLDMKKLNMNKLVLQLINDIEETHPDKKLPFEIRLSEEDIFFEGDDMYAYRIVQNLLDNAVKYSMDGMRIYVKTYAKEGKVYLEIINVSAYPIECDENELKGKFVRGDKSRNKDGNGLGLAIVDAYTRALDGEFHINIIGDAFQAVIEFEAKFAKTADEENY